MGKISLALRKVAPISDSAAEYMIVFMRCQRVWMALLLLFVRVGVLSQFLTSWSARGKWSPDCLRARYSQR